MKISTLAILITMMMFLSSCAAFQQHQADKRRAKYVIDNPIDKAADPVAMREIHERLKDRRLWIGAKKEHVGVMFGSPAKINKTRTAYSKREQWIYGFQAGQRTFIYFRDGVVTSISN